MTITKPLLDVAAIMKLRADHDRLAHEVRELRALLRAATANGGDDRLYEIAKVDASGITAASGLTVTTGTATLHRLPPGETTAVATGLEVQVHNWCGAIPANAYIGLMRDEYRRRWAITGRC